MDVMASTELPQPKHVRDMLLDLLGRDVEVALGDAWSPLPRDMAAAAEFVDDRYGLRAVALLDLPLAVYAGAAIGLVPAGGAQDMVDERMPTSMVEENLFEVLNVMASLFNTDTSAHVKIAAMQPPGADLPADIAQLVRRLTGRLDLNVSIDGYGEGRLALVLA
jgi:hypothetical protein